MVLVALPIDVFAAEAEHEKASFRRSPSWSTLPSWSASWSITCAPPFRVSPDALDADPPGSRDGRGDAQDGDRAARTDSAPAGFAAAELEALKTRGAEDIAAEEARIAETAKAERARLLDQTRREIAMRLRIARRELTEHAAQLAVQVAEQRIARTITPDDQMRLLDRYAAQLGEAPGRQGGAMTSRVAAARYARALFDVVLKERLDVERVERELAAFAELVDGHDTLRRVLSNPAIPPSRKRAVDRATVGATAGRPRRSRGC